MKVLNLTQLVNALTSDPDMAGLNPLILQKIVQTIFVVTGCDYISFFCQTGKAKFLASMFQYSSFITGGDYNANTPGTLVDIHLDNTMNVGFLAFQRLIGVVYFKKHCAAFDVDTPVAHFNKCGQQGLTPEKHHSAWLENIRQTIWSRITYENEMIPTDNALLFHWKRSCWVLHMWRQANKNEMISN